MVCCILEHMRSIAIHIFTYLHIYCTLAYLLQLYSSGLYIGNGTGGEISVYILDVALFLYSFQHG